MKAYIQQYNELIHKAPWYYRLIRRFYNEIFIPINEPVAMFNEKKSLIDLSVILSDKMEELNSFSQQSNFFVRWLLGLNSFMQKTKDLLSKVLELEEKIIDNHQKNIKTELEAIPAAPTNVQELECSINQKLTFFSTIPKLEPAALMPQVISRWGAGYAAIPRVSGNKPMNYANLSAEQKETSKEQERQRGTMIQQREMGFHGMREDRAVDCASGVLGFLSVELKKLATKVGGVEIKEDNTPYFIVK